ncbi:MULTISPECIES: hypothetical protein [unclassified Solwaraspora]|uniref:hypothetical protein n=1 Tax=unclassified Solwaraspora TaxID=2627926 RepID=UPI00259BB530|nr:hypothetical protein [Solwaraspora sp. WMMA2056]WJK42363.1 hypothetical protein O7608_08285 [Solwaraspora sp. WMMA2056]
MSGSVRLVLDTSAILAYAAVSTDVGETIAEVVDEGGSFALPVVCLAEASRRVPEHQASGVSLLAEHPYAVVTSTPAADWRALTEWSRILGRVDVASALFDAITHTAYVLTGEPDAYGDYKDLPVIPFD